jgi:hypothetical protein
MASTVLGVGFVGAAVHRCRFNCNVNPLAVRGMLVGVDGACRCPGDLDEVAVGVAWMARVSASRSVGSVRIVPLRIWRRRRTLRCERPARLRTTRPDHQARLGWPTRWPH